jgi:hypothetical protein
MKKFALVGFLAVVLVAGCELFPSISWEDIRGEWDFANTEFNDSTITTIHLSLMDPAEGESKYRIDLSWNNFENFYYGDGTLSNNIFTGHYQVGGDPDTTEYSITVTFSLSNETLKAVFSGTGPLNGLVLEHGTLGTQ